MITGRGLAGALRQKCPRWLLLIAAAALLSANIIAIGADLGGMSDASRCCYHRQKKPRRRIGFHTEENND
jgi:Mn2+/Fe2+ NRAMP family transporter